MLAYFETKKENICCGCRACEQICHKGAISMVKNSEGFYYPELNDKLCVDCGLCDKVCPEMKLPEVRQPLAVYALQHKNDEVLKKSSSGGAFRLLADEVIKNGGSVVGCIWDEGYQPILHIARTHEELLSMQGSKYLSSNTLDIYSRVETELKEGKKVLFTGAPCQCAGLLKYLRKTYENLLTADFLCHGMPSQKAFDRYLNYIEEKHKIRSLKGKRAITSYHFRDKAKRGWGHVSSYTYSKYGIEHKKYNVGLTDTYICGFLKGYFNRYSCYSCSFKGEKRFTDFTFCDYWGVNAFLPGKFDVSKGVSAITVNSEKAARFKDIIEKSASWEETQIKYIAKENGTLNNDDSGDIPELRYEMYALFDEKPWSVIAKKYLRTKKYFIKRLIYAMPLDFIKKVKRILKVR